MKTRLKEPPEKELEELRKRNAELQKKEEESKQAEDELKAANQQLVASEQQLKAANQQLDASNQQLRASEQEISKKEQEWRESFNSLEDVMLLIDKDFNIEKINANGLKLLGKPEKNVVGRKCYEVIHAMNTPCEGCSLKKSLETGKVESVERFEKDLGGYFSIKTSPVFDEKGRIVRFVDIMRDTTDRKQAEQALQESEEKFRILFESSPDLVALTDLKGTFLDINKVAPGYKKEDVIGTGITDYLTPEQVKDFKAAVSKAIKTGETHSYEPAITTSEGHTIQWYNRVSPLKIKGKNDRLVVNFTDITERRQSEEKTKEIAAKLEGVIQNVPGVVSQFILHKDGSFTIPFLSEQCREIYGYEPEAMQADVSLLFGMYPSEELPRIQKTIGISAEKLETFRLDYRLKDGHGKEKWARTIASPRKLENGDILWNGVTQDICEQKQIEEELKENEKLMRTVAENYPNSYISIIEKDLTVGFTSGQEFKKQDLDPKQFIGLKLEQVFGDKSEIVKKHYKKTFKGEEQSFEILINDQYQYYRTVPLYAEDGSIPQILAVVENITERKQAGEALKNSETRFRAIFESDLIGTIFWDANGEITEANDAFLNIIGYSKDDLSSGELRWRDLTPPEYTESDNKKLKELAEKGVLIPFEKEYYHKDGRKIPIILGAATFPGSTVTGVAFILDITERKKMDEELAKKNKELEQIIYITSHDLRTPLVNVQGFSKELSHSLTELAGNIQSGDIPEKLVEKVSPILKKDIPESLQYIQTSIVKMDALLAGLLRLSRMGRVELTIRKLNMNKLMTNVTDAIEFKIKEQGVNIKVAQLLPCRGDETQVNQVFTNLLENALKYLDPERPGIVKVSCKKQNTESLYCVEDNGIGIAPDYQDNIFDIFHRLNPEQSVGEGLGLAIVRRILDRHNGKIWVESEFGKGSRFYVSLPAG